MDTEKKTYQVRMPSHREQRSPRRSPSNGSDSVRTQRVSSEEMMAIAKLLQESPVKAEDLNPEPVPEETKAETETPKEEPDEVKTEPAPEVSQEEQEDIREEASSQPEAATPLEETEQTPAEDIAKTPQEGSAEEKSEMQTEVSEEGSAEKTEEDKEPEGASEDQKSESEPTENKPASDKKASKWIKDHKLVFSILITAALLVIVLIVLFAVPAAIKTAENASYMDQIRNQEIKVNDVAAIDDFFTSYYTAMSSGNTTALESMFDDPTKAHITTEISTIVNQYDNILVYVTPGINDGDIVAFVYNDIHFANIDAIAPSVDSFYLVYNEDEAALKICSDMYTDQQILKYMNLVSYRDPIRTLLSDTNNSLSEALAGNKDLNNLYILMQSMAESIDNTETEATETTTAAEAESVTEKESETETQTTEK